MQIKIIKSLFGIQKLFSPCIFLSSVMSLYLMLLLKTKQCTKTDFFINFISQIQHLKDKEFKLTRELERLRGHLIQIEDGYTTEALGSEEREKELRNRLAVAEERLSSSSTQVEFARYVCMYSNIKCTLNSPF